MSYIRGINSTKGTNQPQGGGPSKCAPPSTVGVPAGVIRVYPRNTCGVMVDRMSITCRTQSVASIGVDLGLKIIYFENSDLSFLPEIGMAISSGSFGATITDIQPSGEVNTEVYYTSYVGTPPVSDTATYTIKVAGCPS